MNNLLKKASIVLTPTAYSDGSLNTVIPPYQVLSELVTNGDFSDGTSNWSASNASIEVVNGELKIYNQTSSPATTSQVISGLEVGKKYKVTATSRLEGSGGNTARVSFFGNIFAASTSVGQSVTESIEITATVTSATLSLFLYGTSSTEGYFDNISVKEIQEADFDFSRGSSATRVNEQGLVEDVQILSGELVQNGNFEQIGSELVTNGNFDTDSDWSNSGSWSIGNGVATYDGLLNIKRIYQTVNFVQNKIYKISFDITNTVDDYIDLFFGQDATTLIGRTDYAVGSYEFYVTATSTSQNLSIYAYNTSYGGGSIDNVSVKEVGQNWSFGTGWNMGDGKVIADGTMTASDTLNQSYNFTDGNKYRFSFTISDYQSGSVYIREPFNGGSDAVSANGTFTFDYIAGSANEIRFRSDNGFIGSLDNVSYKEVTDDTDLPRIDFTDGTGSLLLEPQRTNLINYSEDFSGWSLDDATVESDSSTSPDGNTKATLLKGNTNSSKHHIRKTLSGTVDGSYSIFAKAKELRYLQIASVNTTNQYVNFDLQDGLVGTVGSDFSNAKIEEFSSGWYRLSVTSDNRYNSFYLSLVSGTNSAWLESWVMSNNTDGLYIWGAQLEQGSYATSYIVSNSGSATTRSADVANNSGNADLFNDSEGVLYAEIKKDSNALDNLFSMITIGDAHNNRLQIYLIDNSNDFGVLVGSSSGTTQISSTFNYGSYNKIALSYNSNGFKVFHDGTLVGSNSNTISGLNLQELKFRFAFNTMYDFYGDVKCVAVFKEALTDSELACLTSQS